MAWQLSKQMADANSRFVDMCFLIDCTGSMEKFIDNAKSKIKQISSTIQTKFNATLRVAIVGYRDLCDKQPVEVMPFTTNESQWINFLNALEATGGGDAAEDIFSGYEQILKLQWQNKTRVLIHIIDAPQHGKLFTDGICGDDYAENMSEDDIKTAVENYMRLIVKKNIDYYLLEVTPALTKKMTSLLKEMYDKNKTKNTPFAVHSLDTNPDTLLQLTINSLTNSITRGIGVPLK